MWLDKLKFEFISPNNFLKTLFLCNQNIFGRRNGDINKTKTDDNSVLWEFIDINSLINSNSCFVSPINWSLYSRKQQEEKKSICTRNRCAQSNKSDSIDGIFEVNEASEMASNITNDSGTDTDHSNGDNEAWISSTQS